MEVNYDIVKYLHSYNSALIKLRRAENSVTIEKLLLLPKATLTVCLRLKMCLNQLDDYGIKAERLNDRDEW